MAKKLCYSAWCTLSIENSLCTRLGHHQAERQSTSSLVGIVLVVACEKHVSNPRCLNHIERAKTYGDGSSSSGHSQRSGGRRWRGQWLGTDQRLRPGSKLVWIGVQPHTLARRVLAKVLGLVPAEEAGGLDLRSRTPGELLVEVDDALHADGIRGSTNGLCGPRCQRESQSERC